MTNDNAETVTGRLRKASMSAADAILNFDPQPGMWAATGTAIAYAPTINELRKPVGGGDNIEFNEYGQSARTVVREDGGMPILSSVLSKTTTRVLAGDQTASQDGRVRPPEHRSQTFAEQAALDEKHGWAEATRHGFAVAWKFVTTPTGFLMTVYGLNVIAWGAMLLFLLLGAAPAMNHPSKDAINSSRKIWIEIDSQILNALFCVTGFGLAPWRFRNLYWLIKARRFKNIYAMNRLNEQNKSWFRPPAWYHENEEGGIEMKSEQHLTFRGEVAPPTSLWKLSFVVWMMVLNTLFRVVLASMMWAYNRINRPTWSTGAFIGLGCGVSLLAGLMMWWELRKVKQIEGPVIKVIDAVDLKKA